MFALLSLLVLLFTTLSNCVTAPDSFIMVFNTTVNKGHGSIIKFNITRSYSPNGVDRLYELLTLAEGSYYNDNAFFRVIPDFVAQFGINGDPTISAEWEDNTIPDDPVVISNLQGTIAYAMAGANSRTTQLFINYADNTSLDSQGFSPIGMVTEGFDVALDINSEYGQKPIQSLIYKEGNSYLEAKFPDLDYITTTSIEY